ncbi:putative LOC100569746 [Trichonephila clavipes]|nr:putative LOC100569746 [Trichonephila clavipes]
MLLKYIKAHSPQVGVVIKLGKWGVGSATLGLLAADHVILNRGQVTWTTPELAPPLPTTTPHQREDVSALDRFNVHRCPTRRELWFQQDGATCHTARATIDLLKDTFGDRLFSRFGPVNWPPRSWDLTPLDYFLWGYVKSLVYADKPQTFDHLEDNIRRVIADIRPQMLGKVIENWTSRLDYIRASHGSPMPDIIFKM